jgi:hypothetical protein
MKIYKEIKQSPFKPLKRKIYLGKIKYYTPYFYPTNFSDTIIKIRKLELLPQEGIEKKFKNLPMVRRSKDWILKVFNTWFWVQIGYPISIRKMELGWKSKYDTPRFEYAPLFMIFFLKWQFVISYNVPSGKTSIYWEMYLWWKYYSDEDIEKAKNTWGWTDGITKKTTWDNNCLK